MRKLALMFIIILAVGAPMALHAASTPAGETPPAAEELRVVGVNVLMGNPDKYQKTVRVRGVVGSVFPKERRLGLIDAIYAGCCSSPCGNLQALPVRWAGDMPSLKSLVMVTGEIKRTGERLEFVASAVEPAEQAGGASK